MALLGMASFDVYDTANIQDDFVSCGLGAIVPGAGRCGSAAWHGTAAVGSGPFAGAAATTLSGFAGWASNADGFSTVQDWGATEPGGRNLVFTRQLPNGAIEGWTGANTVLGRIVCTTPPNLISIGHYVAIGTEWLISTTGYLRIYVNGHLAADSGITNMITAFTTTPQWGGIVWTPSGYIDDLYWGDAAVLATNPWAAYLGDLRVEGQLCLTDAAGGGGTFREWTPSTGTDHGALLDELAPNDDTDYVTSSVNGQRESVKFSNITPTTGAIYGVRTLPNMVKTTFADRVIAAGVYAAGEAYTANQAPAQTTYRYYPAVFGYNPITAAPWSIAGVNASEALVKIVS